MLNLFAGQAAQWRHHTDHIELQQHPMLWIQQFYIRYLVLCAPSVWWHAHYKYV